MRPSDIDTLLRSLLPALSLGMAACTASGPGTASEGPGPASQSGPAVPSDAQPTGKPDGEPDTHPNIQSGGEPDAQSGGAEEGKLETPKLDLPQPKVARPFPTNRASCPSVSWCAPQAAAVKVAADEARTNIGCPTAVLSQYPLGSKDADGLAKDPLYRPLFTRVRSGSLGIDVKSTEASRAGGSADACCYSWTRPCPGGRPFLDSTAQPVVAALRPGHRWTQGDFELDASPRAKSEAAAQWLADASMEHASVASFARTTLELMALGAPAELVTQTQQAALDEIEHARTCMAIASACGAAPVEPGRMKIDGPREATFARFAADTFVEGCIGETTAALAVQRAAAGCANPQLRAALLKIANEEAQHAALAWRSVAWALAQDEDAVRLALRRRAATFASTLDQLDAAPAPCEPRGPSNLELAALGRLDATRLRETQRDAWFGVVEPMLARL